MSRLALSDFYILFRGLFFLTPPLSWAAGPNCYYLNSGYAAANEPCRPSTQVSTCCGPGWACLGNGLCRSTKESDPKYGEGVYGPPTCTDSEWNSIECFNPCRGLWSITPCGKDRYCCGNCKCDNTTEAFFIPGGDFAYTTIGSAATGLVSIASSVSSFSTSASTASSVSSFSTSASTASSVSSLPTSKPSTTPPQSDRSMKIGLGVGIPLTAIVFGAVAIWVLRRERRSKKQMQEMHARMVPFPYAANKNPDPTSQGISTFTHDDPGITREERLLDSTPKPNTVTANELSSSN